MTQTTHTRETWIDACAARYVELGVDAETAKQGAEAAAEMQAGMNGDNYAEWDAPADAADDDISCWGD